MAMYAMGVESSAEVLVYLNRALEICTHNGAMNGYPCYFYVYSLVLVANIFTLSLSLSLSLF